MWLLWLRRRKHIRKRIDIYFLLQKRTEASRVDPNTIPRATPIAIAIRIPGRKVKINIHKYFQQHKEVFGENPLYTLHKLGEREAFKSELRINYLEACWNHEAIEWLMSTQIIGSLNYNWKQGRTLYYNWML